MAEVAENSAISATNVSSAILSIQERGIDFQGKRVLKWISTDFLEMSVNVSVKKYELWMISDE